MKNLLLITTLLLSALLAAGCSFSKTDNSNVAVNTNAAAETTPAGEPAAAGAQSQAAAAEALVADLYKQHDAKKGPFFQTKSRALVDKYFTKPLADLI